MQCQNNLNAKYICMIYNLITKVYSDEILTLVFTGEI